MIKPASGTINAQLDLSFSASKATGMITDGTGAYAKAFREEHARQLVGVSPVC